MPALRNACNENGGIALNVQQHIHATTATGDGVHPTHWHHRNADRPHPKEAATLGLHSPLLILLRDHLDDLAEAQPDGRLASTTPPLGR
eukprot:4034243-Lingulodinium_polyedra.AAC.1